MSYFYGSQLVHLKVEQILWHVLTSIALTIKTSLLHNNYIAPESMVFNQFSFFSDTKEEYDATGKKTYFELCKRLDSTPVSYFIKHMGDTEINLAYHGIGTKGAKAVAGALVVSLIYDFFSLSTTLTLRRRISFSLPLDTLILFWYSGRFEYIQIDRGATLSWLLKC